jgi:two-component system response regulator AlgR
MKVLIVDDEKPARDRLRQLVEDFGTYEVVGEAVNGEEAIRLAARLEPDIVLLDIRMPGIDGIETAHHLNAMTCPPAVVFATAYDDYAVDAFEARAIGYVLKPVRRERLERALEHAARVTGNMLDQLTSGPPLEKRRRHVCAQLHGELRLIPIDSIACFTAEQKYVCVRHDGGTDLIDDSLKSLEEEFGDRFARIHRGALVALDRIERLEKSDGAGMRVVLQGADREDAGLDVSRRHLAELRRRLKGERKA